MSVTVLYTDSDKIRGAVGFTPQDVTDVQVTNANLAVRLEEDLDGWLATHATVKTEGEAGGATDAQKRKWRQLQLYCQFKAAAFLTGAIRLLAAQKIADGAMEMQRFSNTRLEALQGEMEDIAAGYREAIELALEADISPDTFFSVVPPGSDPVTGT